MPTPSITASNIAQPIAEFLAAFMPPLMASEPPVKKPAMTVSTSVSLLELRFAEAAEGNQLALYGSSFFLTPFTAQSNVENKPPHTPKFPPSTGARAFIAVMAPMRRSP